MQVLQTEWFWAMIQAIGVIVTLMLIYAQARVQTSSHVVKTLGAIHTRWTEEAMLRARLHVCSSYLAKSNEFDGFSEYIATFMEELGGYVMMKAVPAEVMWEAHSWYIEHYYWMFRPGIAKVRKTYHDETLYEYTDSLFKMMAAISKRRAAPGSERGEEDLKRFAESEVQIATAFLHLQESRQSQA